MYTLIIWAMFTATSCSCQTSSNASFTVQHVEVYAKFDSAYILALANDRLPHNKRVTEADVQCLLNELRNSGLFKDVKAKWNNEAGVRRLSLYTTSKRGRPQMSISKFSLHGLPAVNQDEFLKRMGEKGVFTGMRLLQFTYDELNDIIDESINQSVPADMADKHRGSAWIEFRTDALGGVEVRILHEQTDCVVRTSLLDRTRFQSLGTQVTSLDLLLPRPSAPLTLDS